MMVFPFQVGNTFATSGCASKRTARKTMSAVTASASFLGMIWEPIAAAADAKLSGARVVATDTSMPLRANALAKAWPILPKPIIAYLIRSPWVYRALRRAEQSNGAPGRRASELCKTAVNGDLAGGHEAAVRRGEKGRHGRDFCRISHTLKRSHRRVGLLARLAQRFLREFGRRRPRRQHVYPDAAALQVLRPGSREVAHCRLARAVGAHSRSARGAGARSGQNDRTALAHQRQRLLDREDRALHIGVEGFVNVLGGDLAERKRASRPGIGEDDVEGSALGLHRRVESVEVGQIGDRALHRAGIGPKFGDSGVERFLSAAKDEDEGALLDEAFCGGAADASSTTGDHGGLSIQSGHVVHPS